MKTKGKKQKVLIDAEVVIDLHTYCGMNDMDRYAKALESAVRDFEHFLRDHRSQDVNGMQVRRVYEERCSLCGHEWETMRVNDDGEDDPTAPLCCAWCGEELDDTEVGA